MDQVFPMLGVWVWFVAAGLLMLLELFSPGVFLLWLGVAAALLRPPETAKTRSCQTAKS